MGKNKHRNKNRNRDKDKDKDTVKGPNKNEKKQNMALDDGNAKQLERPSTPEMQPSLPLAGKPITPKNALQHPIIITPKLRKAMASEDVEELSNIGRSGVTTITTQLIEKQANQLAEAYRAIMHRQQDLEMHLDALTSTIGLIGQKWADGRIDTGQGDYKEEREVLLKKQLELMTAVSVTRSMGSQLAGRWSDDMATGTRVALDDWAYIDAAIRCYPEVALATKSVKSKRTPQREKAFRKELIEAYDCMDAEGGSIWCPVEQKYFFSEYGVVVAAHIVNANVGEKTAQALFGDDREHVWDKRNGLMISRAYEKLLDSAKAVILPVSDSPDETEFQFFLLTKDIGRRKGTYIWGDELHGRRLVFQNDFRPSKRYLYFKFVISVLRRRRAEVPGYLTDLENLPSFGKSLWASPGPYLKRSILYKFSRQLGCMTTEDADQFWGVSEVPMETLSDENDNVAATMAVMASTSISAQDEIPADSDSEEEGSEDDDESDIESDKDDVFG